MSFQNKGFWMPKGAGHVNDGDATYGNPSRIEPKRPHQWFVDAAEPELFPNKKQAVHIPNSKLGSGMSNENVSSWENASSFQSVPHQFIDRLFGSDPASSVNFAERNVSPVGSDNWNIRKGIDDQFGEDSPVSLSVSHAMEDPETCLNYAGIRKVKVNQVRDSDNGMHASREHGSNRGSNSNLSSSQAFDRVNETAFLSVGQAYDKEHGSVTLIGHPYNHGDAHVRPIDTNYGKGDENAISVGDNCSKGNANMISFGGFPDEQDIMPIGRPVGNYDQLYHPDSVQTLETSCEKDLDASNASAVDNTASLAKPRLESVSKNKPEIKPSRKPAPNSFPSNVRSLISTGMLDGVPVKYVSLAREELRGIIKGVGYLCGCQSCNYAKVLNAYEFERHAGCKTKHPNNHIYFENGKTIYQIVQELRSTPESLLFDTLQTVFGAPINQKSFHSWKESFQAATRELQRIYGKEELNL
ncbi:PREDICTED: DNA-binding [Prunus dulcis]|uniref:PREDICTED: DNA-binding n=1 Tax=Prunus dulcis TaxID=3755 RepID=A0A5E4F5W5_PRUDU|nr:uncharacterized protein LOC117629583 [Prunus dulcis]VVA23132.1 PREDICTED: DNA-binding [Prunus dulcis]